MDFLRENSSVNFIWVLFHLVDFNIIFLEAVFGCFVYVVLLRGSLVLGKIISDLIVDSF